MGDSGDRQAPRVAWPRRPATIVLNFEGLALPLMNVWQRLHWTKRRKITEDVAWMARAQVQRLGLPLGDPRKFPLSCCAVAVVRHSLWRGRGPDVDSMVCKPILDVLQPMSDRHPYGIGLIEDDGPEAIESYSTSFVRGPALTVVIIRPVESSDG